MYQSLTTTITIITIKGVRSKRTISSMTSWMKIEHLSKEVNMLEFLNMFKSMSKTRYYKDLGRLSLNITDNYRISFNAK